jgi:hypothetical protein
MGALFSADPCGVGGGVGCGILESCMIPAAEFQETMLNLWILCQAEAWGNQQPSEELEN